MQIGIVGINHKLADLKLREALAKTCQRRFSAQSSLHDRHCFLLLSTCNRTEVYYSSENLAETHTYILSILRQELEEEFEHKLYSYFGYDCFYHLTCVTAGLDSAIVAETEIQGQVKNAYEAATSCSKLPYELHYLFQKALKVSKEVRHNLILGRGMPEAEHAIFQTGTHLFKNFSNAKILFVGASEINLKVLKFFKLKKFENISLCNRSFDKAKIIAEKHQIKVASWKSLNFWEEYDWIIFGTKAPHYLIQKNPRLSFSSQKLIIDLSFPRNVDPKIGQNPQVVLLNIDQINRMLKFRKKWLDKTLVQAEELISDATKYQIDLFREKRIHRSGLAVVGA